MIRARCIALAVLGASLFAQAAFGNSGTATFENYPEGFSSSAAVTDPLSGITFKNFLCFDTNTGNLTPSGMAIDFVGNLSLSPVFNNTNFLSGGGYAPGPGFGLQAGFVFDAAFPTPAAFVSLDIFATLDAHGLVTVTGFDAIGNPVASGSWVPGVSSAWPSGSVSLFSGSANIASISVRDSTTDGIYFATGFDNIHFQSDAVAPEPTSLGILAAGMLALLRRRRA